MSSAYSLPVIWLLRHADAEDAAADDASRRLTEKGERQSRVAGRALAKLDVHLDACLLEPEGEIASNRRDRVR